MCLTGLQSERHPVPWAGSFYSLNPVIYIDTRYNAHIFFDFELCKIIKKSSEITPIRKLYLAASKSFWYIPHLCPKKE